MTTIHPTPTRSTQPLVALAADAVGAEELEDVVAGDLGQAGHDQDVGDDDAPAAPPPGLRAEGARPPGEGGAAVRVGVVQRLVAVGDEQHRHEGDDRDDRRLQPVDGDDDEAERGGQAVGRGGGGHARPRPRRRSRGPSLQALVARFLSCASVASRCTMAAPVLSKESRRTILKHAGIAQISGSCSVLIPIWYPHWHRFQGLRHCSVPEIVRQCARLGSDRSPRAASGGSRSGAATRASG